MANSLAFGLSKIGLFFVVLAPVLGWVGVALSGSNTSTNAMFGPVQAMTGRLLHLPVLMLPSFNSGRVGSGQTDRAANRQRGRFDQQTCAQRRPGHPAQYGLDAHPPCLSDPDQRPFLLFFPEFDVAVGQASACLFINAIKTDRLKNLCGNCQIFVGHGFTGCGKTRFWCHSERSEESLFDLSPMHREILRFAQNDKRTFSAACSAVP